jgi:hypothetical protein
MFAEHEKKLRVSQVGHLFPVGRHGKNRRPETIARYIARGIEIAGQVIRLEGGVDTDGRRWWTTAEAVERFLQRLTAAKIGEMAPLPAPPSRQPISKAAAEFQRMRDRARPNRRRLQPDEGNLN